MTYHFRELKPSLLLDVSLEEVLPCRTSSGGGDVLPSILLREPISEGVLIGVELGESTVGPALAILRRPFNAGVGLLQLGRSNYEFERFVRGFLRRGNMGLVIAVQHDVFAEIHNHISLLVDQVHNHFRRSID